MIDAYYHTSRARIRALGSARAESDYRRMLRAALKLVDKHYRRLAKLTRKDNPEYSDSDVWEALYD